MHAYLHSECIQVLTNVCGVLLCHLQSPITVRWLWGMQSFHLQFEKILTFACLDNCRTVANTVLQSEVQQKVDVLILMRKAHFWQDQNRWVSVGLWKVQIISSNRYSFSVVLILTSSHLLWHHDLETSCNCQKQNITTWKMLHQVCYLISEKLSDYYYYFCCCCYYYYYYYYY
jgi:hypothetical protein